MNENLATSLSSAAISARRFYDSPTEPNAYLLNVDLSDIEYVEVERGTSSRPLRIRSRSETVIEKQLSMLNTLESITSQLDIAKKLSIKNVNFIDLMRFSASLLNAKTTSAVTRSRLVLVLFNLAYYNVSVRKYFAAEPLHICGTVFEALRISLANQLGPQNLIDILRLILVLSHERSMSLGVWTNDLISFLLSEIVRDDETEWMPYCAAILSSLASRSKSVCQRIRSSTSYKTFCHKILKLLSHDSRMVVISALVLAGYLEEKLRNKVMLYQIFCSQNLPQTFQCIFNVISIGDCLMIRLIAADLLKRLIVSDAPSTSSTPQLALSGKDLVNYSFFDSSVERLAFLFVELDPRSEDSLKIYDVFLTLCSLPNVVSRTAHVVLCASTMEDCTITPLQRICAASKLSFLEAITPDVPLMASQLLRYLLKECVDSGRHIQEFLSLKTVLQLIESHLKTTVETNNELISYQCNRIWEGLRLAEVVSIDDEMRTEILDVVSAQLCSHLIESQMISSGVMLFMSHPNTSRSSSISDWSEVGVSIVLEIIKVLADLKDYSKSHKDQYWKLLKDERLIPFIAYAVAHGNHEMICDALHLYTHCAQIHAFPTERLSDLIASCARTSLPEKAPAKHSSSRSLLDMATEIDKQSNGRVRSSESIVSETVSSSKSDDKEKSVAKLFDFYNRKIDLLQIRQKELENLLAKKDESLKQSERLRLLSCNDRSESEVTVLRQLIIDNGKKIIEFKNLIISLRSERDEGERLNKTMKEFLEAKQKEKELLSKELCKAGKENEALMEENRKEREFSATIKIRYDDIKCNFDKASAALIERDREYNNLLIEVASLRADFNEKILEIKGLNERIVFKEKELALLSNKFSMCSSEREASKKELEKISKFKDRMLQMMGEI